VGIERDIFHLLRLPSRLTPPSVSLTHTVKRPCAEAQRFHAIKMVVGHRPITILAKDRI
jgi:hypothetical protein